MDLVLIIIGVVLGYVLGHHKVLKIKKPKTTPKGRVLMMTIHEDHMEPKYYSYSKGFSDITKCQSCNMTGLYEDQHPSNCCNRCGGIVKIAGSAIWDIKDRVLQWVEMKKK